MHKTTGFVDLHGINLDCSRLAAGRHFWIFQVGSWAPFSNFPCPKLAAIFQLFMSIAGPNFKLIYNKKGRPMLSSESCLMYRKTGHCINRLQSMWIHFVSLVRHVGLTPTDFEKKRTLTSSQNVSFRGQIDVFHFVCVSRGQANRFFTAWHDLLNVPVIIINQNTWQLMQFYGHECQVYCYFIVIEWSFVAIGNRGNLAEGAWRKVNRSVTT